MTCSIIGSRGGGPSCYEFIPWASLPVQTGPLYQYKKVAQSRASLSVHYSDKKVCTDTFCTDSESDKGGLVIHTVPTTRPLCIIFHNVHNRWPRVCNEEAVHDDDPEINDANSKQSKPDGYGSDDIINPNQ
jgi:hypothetical protein